MKIEINASHIEQDWLVEAVVQKVLERFHESNERAFDSEVRERVSAVVSAKCDALAMEKLTPLIDDVLTNGFRESRGYGDERVVTVRERIGSYFQTDRYNSRSWMQELITKKVEELMKAEFQPQIEEVRKAFRGRLDSLLGEKLSLAVREAVGLK